MSSARKFSLLQGQARRQKGELRVQLLALRYDLALLEHLHAATTIITALLQAAEGQKLSRRTIQSIRRNERYSPAFWEERIEECRASVAEIQRAVSRAERAAASKIRS
jgi:hypothetical protein